jgi:ketosteroid isomerase-like protein
MNASKSIAVLGVLVAACNPAPEPDPWPGHALAMRDSISTVLAAYGDRFRAADLDSVERFYEDDPEWSWAANGRVRLSSREMIRSRLEGLRRYPQWYLFYTNMNIAPLGPGLAAVTTEYKMSFMGGGAAPLVYEGALTAFWSHRPGGWKMVGGHTSALAVQQ